MAFEHPSVFRDPDKFLAALKNTGVVLLQNANSDASPTSGVKLLQGPQSEASPAASDASKGPSVMEGLIALGIALFVVALPFIIVGFVIYKVLRFLGLRSQAEVNAERYSSDESYSSPASTSTSSSSDDYERPRRSEVTKRTEVHHHHTHTDRIWVVPYPDRQREPRYKTVHVQGPQRLASGSRRLLSSEEEDE